MTFDGIVVSFQPYDFDHAFFENKAYGPTFAIDRALRVRWIGRALKDPHAGLFSGWVPLSDSYDNNRRVCLVNDYVVIIEFICGSRHAKFVTAFDASPRTSVKIMSGPRWPIAGPDEGFDYRKCLVREVHASESESETR